MKFLACLLTFLPSVCLAEAAATPPPAGDILCKKGEVTRLVHLEEKGTTCTLQSGGKVVYSAQHSPKYCAGKVESHKARLVKLGYVCG